MTEQDNNPLAGIVTTPLTDAALLELLREPRGISWANGLAMAAELWRLRTERDRLRAVNNTLLSACSRIAAWLDGLAQQFEERCEIQEHLEEAACQLRMHVELAASPEEKELI